MSYTPDEQQFTDDIREDFKRVSDRVLEVVRERIAAGHAEWNDEHLNALRKLRQKIERVCDMVSEFR